jgi:hypothetical protein
MDDIEKQLPPDPAKIVQLKPFKGKQRSAATADPMPDPAESASFGCWVMDVNGLWEIKKSQQSDTRLRISDPFEILGRSRNPEGQEWGLCLRFEDGDKKVHTVTVTIMIGFAVRPQ